jgi:hypothetical protein
MLNFVEPTLLKSPFNIAAFIKLRADTHERPEQSEAIFLFLLVTIAAIFPS